LRHGDDADQATTCPEQNRLFAWLGRILQHTVAS
jgi:hypothetical protein